MVKQKRCKLKGTPPSLQVVDENGEPKTIHAGTESRLLRCNFAKDLAWKQQLEVGETALLPTIRSKLGALKHISCGIPSKERKLLVEGIILSKIFYLIPIFGGAPKQYMKKIQILLNKSARLVLKTSKLTSTRKLMEETGWLYAKELAIYHTLIVTWQILRQNTPQYFSTKMEMEDECFIATRAPRLLMTASSFRCRRTIQ